jgi:hypothetical protein
VALQERAAAVLVSSLKKPCGGTFHRLTPVIRLPSDPSCNLETEVKHSLRGSAMQGFEEDCAGAAVAPYLVRNVRKDNEGKPPI